jgi:hypothetical protein
MSDPEIRYLAVRKRFKQDYGLKGDLAGRSQTRAADGKSRSAGARHTGAYLAGSVERAREKSFE